MSANLLPDPSNIAATARNSEWLQKELEMRRLQEQLGKSRDKDQELREATKGFESIFIAKLWQQMRATVPKDGYLHSKEEEMYLSMFDKDMADKMADAGGIGLGEMLYRHLKKSMDDASRVTSPSGAEERLPLRPLRTAYDPRLLTPPEHRHQEHADAAKAVPTAQRPFNPDNLDDFYDDMDEYADLPGEQVPNMQPAPDAAASQLEFGLDSAALRPTPEPEQARVPLSAEELAVAKADASIIQVEPEVLAAVESLARDIAPHGSPVTRDADRTSLRSRTRTPEQGQRQGRSISDPRAEETASGQTAPGPPLPDVGAPLLAREATAAADTQGVEQLEQGIRRTEGAMQNAGGPHELRPAGVEASPAAPPQASGPVSREPTAPIHWPVDGRQTSEFGWRTSPFTGERIFHAGVDLAANHGDPVRACWDGTVIFAGNKPGYGKLVIVEHSGGWQSYYGHNSRLQANVGDEIKAGQNIAQVGSTGLSTGPHVHFELRRNGTAMDPLKVQQSLMAGRPLDRAV
jgi:peptidoglycan hydrolase FlgJ